MPEWPLTQQSTFARAPHAPIDSRVVLVGRDIQMTQTLGDRPPIRTLLPFELLSRQSLHQMVGTFDRFFKLPEVVANLRLEGLDDLVRFRTFHIRH